MNADKTYTGRELEGARQPTARPVDESPHGTAHRWPKNDGGEHWKECQ